MTNTNSAAARLETKFLAFDPDAGFADGRIEGYASLFDVVDGGGDEVAPGAFAAALRRADRRPKLLWQHDPARPIGVWEELREDDRGLRVRGRLLTEIQGGAEAAALLRAGAIDGLSIGYRAVRSARAAKGGRRLLEIDLWEVSLVTFPMLPEARAIGADGRGGRDAEARALAYALREARDLFDPS
jgi:HK97 family phage prohead protease